MFLGIISFDTHDKPLGWGKTLAEENTEAQRGKVTLKVTQLVGGRAEF